MHAVTPSPFDGLVNLPEGRLEQLEWIRRVGPAAVGHGQAHEVEAPMGHPLEVGRDEGFVTAAPFGVHGGPFVGAIGEFLLQVESAPSRQVRGGGRSQQRTQG
jgi:hypothetical protein